MTAFQPPFTQDPATGGTASASEGPQSGASDRIEIGGMTCQHCVRAVEFALSGVPGLAVNRVEIGHADVSVDPGASREDAMAAARTAIEAEGYTPA